MIVQIKLFYVLSIGNNNKKWNDYVLDYFKFEMKIYQFEIKLGINNFAILNSI